jgi:hypothetical protein
MKLRTIERLVNRVIGFTLDPDASVQAWIGPAPMHLLHVRVDWRPTSGSEWQSRTQTFTTQEINRNDDVALDQLLEAVRIDNDQAKGITP